MPDTDPRTSAAARLSRRQFLRAATGVAAAAAAGPLLAGCQRRPTPLPTPMPSLGPSPRSGSGTIRWAEHYSSLTPEAAQTLGIDAQTGQAWVKSVIDVFQRENPGWTVQTEPIAWDHMDAQSIIDFNANQPHDLLFTSPHLMAKHRKLGDLRDLTAYVQSLTQRDLDDLSWNPIWRAASVDNQQLGVALGVRPRVLLANRELLQAARVDERSIKTLDDLLAAAQKLARPADDMWGLGLCAGDAAALVEGFYAPLVWHFGGDFYDATSRTATLGSDASVQAAQWLRDLVYTQKVASPAGCAPTARYDKAVRDPFVAGKLALAPAFSSDGIAGLQQAGLLKECVPAAAGCNTGKVVALPLPTAAHAQAADGWCLSIHALSANPEMAWRLAQVILRPDNVKSCPDAGLPPRLSMWRAREYSSAFYKTWLEAAQASRPLPATPYYNELLAATASALSDILYKQAGVRETLQTAEDDWNSTYAGG